MPRTWESRRPTVTASWLTVPRPPRKLSGAISLMYIGTREVFSPVQGEKGKKEIRGVICGYYVVGMRKEDVRVD